MDLKKLTRRAVDIRDKYDQLNKEHGVVWNAEDFMSGFVGDVGDLSKLIMAKRGLREVEDIDKKLAHELSDCLWSVLVLADKYGLDLETEFLKTMDSLGASLKSKS